jgi:hypothetical protein
MQSKWRKTQLGRIVLIGLVLGASALVARASGVIGPVLSEEAYGQRREIQTATEIDQPTISFIDSPSATCYQPDSSRNTCIIEWSYLNVSAGSSQYIITLTASIDNHLVAYHSGFFQTSMYIPDEMVGHGFKVACGPRNASGLGKTYAYTLRARETGGLSAANYGSVTCPGVYLVYAPSIRR